MIQLGLYKEKLTFYFQYKLDYLKIGFKYILNSKVRLISFVLEVQIVKFIYHQTIRKNEENKERKNLGALRK